MKRSKEIDNTLAGTDLGNSVGNASRADLERGYSDGAAHGNYEGALAPERFFDVGGDGVFQEFEGGERHSGFIEPDNNRQVHGEHGEYGFLRRPTRKTDVERN